MDIAKESKKYTFLLCSERSGSNFIAKLMNNHSKICGPSTKHIINPLARNYFRYQPFNTTNWESLIDDILNLFNVNFSVWKSSFSKQEILENVPQGNLTELINYFFYNEAKINNKDFLFIKEIKLYEFYDFLKVHFPNANYVYQVRDPRDMALSWKKNNSHKGGVISAAKQWKNDQQQFLKIKALEEFNDNIVFFKYEDLVSNSKDTILPFLNKIGVSFEDEMLVMGKDELTNKNASQQKAWENLAKPIIKDNFNKFQNGLSEKEIQYIEAICYFEMIELGYEPLNTWSILEEINNSDIENYNNLELSNLEYMPTIGIIENMKAKKRFYQYFNKKSL